ncbi:MULTISPECIES: hypothetical protein [unclassified Sphingopyxis]|uniref:hypothetical protein n=1 Tax=unclassified Sphingopyxis TaxID=2614943 RepID=UPI0012E34D19|nr:MULTISPECIES: hypothetical protein [unclassified Sphingopyxis]
MTEQTEAAALSSLIETLDYELVMEAIREAVLASQDFNTRQCLDRLSIVIGGDFPRIIARHNELTEEPIEPISPEPEA